MAKNFKPGDKVVYKRCDHKINPIAIEPPEDKPLTIKGRCPTHNYHWEVVEYRTCKLGTGQSVPECCLHPIQPKTVTLELHKIKLEPKKVLIETEYLTTEQ